MCRWPGFECISLHGHISQSHVTDFLTNLQQQASPKYTQLSLNWGVQKIVLSSNKKNEMGSACGAFSKARKYVQVSWYEYLKESVSCVNIQIIKRVWKKSCGNSWAAFIWLKVGTSSGYLLKSVMNLGVL